MTRKSQERGEDSGVKVGSGRDTEDDTTGSRSDAGEPESPPEQSDGDQTELDETELDETELDETELDEDAEQAPEQPETEVPVEPEEPEESELPVESGSERPVSDRAAVESPGVVEKSGAGVDPVAAPVVSRSVDADTHDRVADPVPAPVQSAESGAGAAPTEPAVVADPEVPAEAAVEGSELEYANPIAGFLSAVGLGAVLAPNGPAAPFGAAGLWAVLGWVRRQFEHTFFNKAPGHTTQEVEVSLDGSGELVELSLEGASDPDPEDTVTYVPGSYSSPAGSTLVVAADGTAFYVAGADAVDGVEVFTVSTTDHVGNGWHVHGVSGLLHSVTFGLLGSDDHTGTHTVSVALSVADGDVDAGPTSPEYSTDGPPEIIRGDDGTVALVTRTGSGDDSVLTVTVLRPGTEGPITFTDTGNVDWRSQPVAVGADGTVTLTTTVGTDDTAATTVTVLRPDTTTVVTQTFDGGLGSHVQMGADGTVVLSTREGGNSTVRVLRPDGSDTEFTVNGIYLYGFAVGADGTVGVSPPAGMVHVLRPGETVPVEYDRPSTHIFRGFTVGADGTVVLVGGLWSDGEPETTVVTVVRPGADESEIFSITGLKVGDVGLGADGTVVLTTSIGDQTTVTTLNSDGGQEAVTLTGNPSGGVQVGADGTVAQTTSIGDQTTVTVWRPDDGSMASFALTGTPSGLTQVAPDGSVVQITTAEAGEVMVTVLRPDLGRDEFVVDDTMIGSVQVNADGAIALTTRAGENTTVMVSSPDGTTEQFNVAGTPEGEAQWRPDGTLTVLTSTTTEAGTSYTTSVVAPTGSTAGVPALQAV